MISMMLTGWSFGGKHTYFVHYAKIVAYFFFYVVKSQLPQDVSYKESTFDSDLVYDPFYSYHAK